MKVLVIGSGGREHALAWKLKQSAGVEEVLASFFLLQIEFIREDLPTLDLPMKAYSGNPFFGHISTLVLLIINRLDLTCIAF